MLLFYLYVSDDGASYVSRRMVKAWRILCVPSQGLYRRHNCLVEGECGPYRLRSSEQPTGVWGDIAGGRRALVIRKKNLLQVNNPAMCLSAERTRASTKRAIRTKDISFICGSYWPRSFFPGNIICTSKARPVLHRNLSRNGEEFIQA